MVEASVKESREAWPEMGEESQQREDRSKCESKEQSKFKQRGEQIQRSGRVA